MPDPPSKKQKYYVIEGSSKANYHELESSDSESTGNDSTSNPDDEIEIVHDVPKATIVADSDVMDQDDVEEDILLSSPPQALTISKKRKYRRSKTKVICEC